MQGTIVAVCTSPMHGIPKYPQTEVLVCERGLWGDFHNRLQRRSFSTKSWVPNTDRHLLIMGIEVHEALKGYSAGPGITIPFEPGCFSENILVRGLGDLSGLKGGERFVLNAGKVRVRIIKQAEPCKNVRARYGLRIYEALRGRRGVYCSIEDGVGQKLRAGQPIERLGGGEGAPVEPSPKDKPTADAAVLEPDPA